MKKLIAPTGRLALLVDPPVVASHTSARVSGMPSEAVPSEPDMDMEPPACATTLVGEGAVEGAPLLDVPNVKDVVGMECE